MHFGGMEMICTKNLIGSCLIDSRKPKKWTEKKATKKMSVLRMDDDRYFGLFIAVTAKNSKYCRL